MVQPERTNLLCCNEDRTSCAIVRREISSNELKVWDVASNRVDAVVSLGESVPTCTSFLPVGEKRSVLLVGSISGELTVVDPLSNAVLCKLSGHSEEIKGICVLSKKCFATGGVDGTVKFWSYSDRKKECALKHSFSTNAPITCLASNYPADKAGNILALGSQMISLYDVAAKKLIRKLSGHSTGALTRLHFCTDGTRLVSTAANDNSVYIWDASMESDRSDPLFSASFSGEPTCLSANDSFVAVVCNGAAKIVTDIAGEAKKRVRTIKSAAEVTFSCDPIIASYLCNDTLLTVRGNALVPGFEVVPLFDSAGQLSDRVVNRDTLLSSTAPESRKKKKPRKEEPEIISGASASLRPVAEQGRLEAKSGNETFDGMLVDGDEAEGLKSVTNLLIQGLVANNSDLIEAGLNVKDEAMIMESIEKLPQTVSFLLLEALVSRIARKPARIIQLSPWIKCLHIIHGDHICCMQNYQLVMKPLQDCIALHTESFKLLIKLKAKVDLLIARNAYRQSKALPVATTNRSESFVGYEEKESDDNDTEDDDDTETPDNVQYENSSTDDNNDDDDDDVEMASEGDSDDSE